MLLLFACAHPVRLGPKLPTGCDQRGIALTVTPNPALLSGPGQGVEVVLEVRNCTMGAATLTGWWTDCVDASADGLFMGDTRLRRGETWRETLDWRGAQGCTFYPKVRGWGVAVRGEELVLTAPNAGGR